MLSRGQIRNPGLLLIQSPGSAPDSYMICLFLSPYLCIPDIIILSIWNFYWQINLTKDIMSYVK